MSFEVEIGDGIVYIFPDRIPDICDFVQPPCPKKVNPYASAEETAALKSRWVSLNSFVIECWCYHEVGMPDVFEGLLDYLYENAWVLFPDSNTFQKFSHDLAVWLDDLRKQIEANAE